MNITKDKLSLIGISIKVNRKERLRTSKAAKWTQVNFIKDICSPNTFIHVEHGVIPRYPNLYNEFAKKLGLQVGSFPKVDRELEKVVNKLYVAIEFYDVKKIEKYISKALDILKDYTDYLWYCDAYEVYKSLDDYYNFNQQMSELKLEKFMDMIDEFDDKTNDILKSLIFSSAQLNDDYSEMEKAYKIIKIEDSTFICNKINKLLYYFNTEKTSKFLRILSQIEEECEETKNYSRLLDVYNTAVIYLSNFDKDEIHNYIYKIEDLIKLEKMPKIKLNDSYFNLGMTYYYLKDYEKSIKLFEKNLKQDASKTKPTFMFLASSQRKCNRKISLPLMSNEELNKFSYDARLIYKYFTMESKVPPFVRQKFIMEEILPNLRKEDELSIKLIRDELECIMQQTSQYKDSVIFDIKVRNLIESN